MSFTFNFLRYISKNKKNTFKANILFYTFIRIPILTVSASLIVCFTIQGHISLILLFIKTFTYNNNKEMYVRFIIYIYPCYIDLF